MKSHVNLTSLCGTILLDGANKCYTAQVDYLRDLVEIENRVKHEGLSFLTITLPNFCQEFERALEQKLVSHTQFQGWKKRKCLPLFLGGFTRLVFSVATGALLDDPDICAIECIRQLCLAFKKILIPCSEKKVKNALNQYVKTEAELTLSETSLPSILPTFTKVCNLLWGNMFEDFDSSNLIPKHGPGTTGERIIGNKKFIHKIWHDRLNAYFPYDSFACVSINHALDNTYGAKKVDFPGLDSERPVRVVTVPKTQKAPRIIAIEPVCMQYAQQAVSSYMVKKIQSSYITSGHINFTDQSVNKKLALQSSVDQKLACLDLSEASDRVPLSLVTHMYSNAPDLFEAMYACRSRTAQLPDGTILYLKKFASMGSALCFPVEACYFFSVVVSTLLVKHKLPVTLRNIWKLSRKVYVYGDDIFIPINEVEVVTRSLAEFSCKVNYHKSFWNGKFRESCGTDAYDGCNVTPTYIRRMLPCDKKQKQEIISCVSTSNLFFKKGYWHTSNFLRVIVENLLGKLPVVLETSPGIGWYSFCKQYSQERWNRRLHRYEVKTYIPSPVLYKDKLTSWPALMKCLLGRSEDKIQPSERSKEHLLKSSRSGTVSLKRRWTTPF